MTKLFASSSDFPVAETAGGKIRGFQYGTTFTFHGIKYADAKRFHAPEPVQPWDGVKDALSYGYVCPLLQQDVPNGEVMVPHRYWPMDENCQYLNIWTQHLGKGAKCPVMVWLHGGGFYAGSSIEQQAYDGDNLSAFGDVVVISLNHRLNILGYLNLEPYGDEYANSGNLGNADIVAALKWIRENIEAFGGDPNNVTLFGQSGGGMKIWTLMQTPEADGLYHKGIIQSGILEDFMHETTTDSRPLVEAMLAELGCESGDVKALETMPYNRLADAYNKVSTDILIQGDYIGGYPIQNDFYLGDPLHVGFTEYAKTVPIIMGSCMGELGFMPDLPGRKQLREEIHRMLRDKFGDAEKEIAGEFSRAFPGSHLTNLLTYDIFFRKPAIDFIKALSGVSRTNVYSYVFAYEFPYNEGKTAWHCSDIAFCFRNTDKIPISNIPGVSDRLENLMSSAWVNFAASGEPGVCGDITWIPCRADRENTMVFDNAGCRLAPDFDHKLQKLIADTGVVSPFAIKNQIAWKKMLKEKAEKEKAVFLH
ncbi:carboxylesterase/lipase family protein [Lachnoclostridium sp. Marseille-P6806]|uniref:carboxylesterase/lipase family protein n=1 Tax=Lachnoclostridium sp. Marseille-P6806 TaxID=2364793 RepID=UPI001030AFFE|nr:carboxylesterase family protein [Lachnoclostridium sp. Marseille-P6806]